MSNAQKEEQAIPELLKGSCQLCRKEISFDKNLKLWMHIGLGSFDHAAFPETWEYYPSYLRSQSEE